MQKKVARLGRLLASGLVFMAMFAYVIWLTSAEVAAKTAVLPQTPTVSPIIDGVIDAAYGAALATDPAGDNAQGNANMDLLDLYVTDDAYNFYVAFTINDDIDATNWGKYALYIDTTNDANGATSDAWGRSVTVSDTHKPEFGVYSWVDAPPYGSDHTQLHAWDQGAGSWSNIGQIADGAIGAGTTSVIEWQIAKADVGNPSTIWVEVWNTGGGDFDNAQDTINDPADDWNALDWSTPAVLANSTQYDEQNTPQGAALVVTAPTEGQQLTTPNVDVTGSVVPTTAVTVTVNLNDTNLYTPTVDGTGNFVQPVTLPLGSSVITVTADNGIAPTVEVRNVSFGAGHDNDVWWGQLGHNSRDTTYRTPEAAVIAGTAVSLRFRAASNDLTAAKARVYNDLTNTETFYDMAKVSDDGEYEWWEITLPASSEPTIYWYWFMAIDGTKTVYYQDDDNRDGSWGEPMDENADNSWQLTIYDPSFHTPDWVKNAIIYQIFPDRFQNGDVSNDPAPNRFFYNESGSILRSNTTFTDTNAWNTVVCDPREVDADCEGYYSHNFYGGDLQGVINELDYLADLGVTAIYFNPLFESPSNHKYDTANYETIAADFGDLSTFITMTTEAHNRGIKVILDGVFNHTSSDSSYFDRYSNFDAIGACESESSPYRDWYYFTDVEAGTGDCVGSDGTPLAANYESWFGYDSLPKLNAGNQEVRDYIFAGTQDGDAIALQWMLYADGWRFDVGGDIDPGAVNDPENLFWEEFRTMLLSEYPDSYMVIEEWGNASSWLLGNEMDATMNYPYGTAMMGFWRDTTFVDNDHNSGSSAGEIVPLSPSEINGRLHNWIERYPPEAMYAMMNLLGSHDTNRPMFMLDHNAADANDDSLLQDPAYDWSDSVIRQKGVALLQMTLPGAPTLYYGDEVGLVGPTYYHNGKWEDDPYNRQPFPWLGGDNGLPFYEFLQSQANQDDMHDYYQLLMGARNDSPALRIGSFDTLLLDDANGIYAYGRKTADNSDAAIVIASRAGTIDAPITLSVTVDVDGYVPVGAIFTDTLNGNGYTVDVNGLLTVTVPGQSGALLLLDAPIAQPPTAVSLTLVSEADSSIVISWTMAVTATSYDVYRSDLSGGAGTIVTNTTNLVYTDTGLVNAQPYYYTIVSRDDGTGLTSDPSNEVMGVPHQDLGWYNLQWPHEFTHTISAITRTESIYAQVWIAGATGSDGPAEGVSAQIGYAISGTNPITPTLWTWVDMEYQGIAGANDQYEATLLPSVIGDYQYFARWSADGGQTWFDADIDGPGVIDNLGVMHVVASDDNTSPASTTLYLAGTTAGSISLNWDAVADADLSGYELYRQNVAAPGYALVATVGVTTTYVDDSVNTGETYQYYVQAFDTSFNRADDSNVVTATAEARFVEVTFRVAVPAYTPGTVYVVGDLADFGPWNPSGTPMNQVGSTDVWTYTLNILDGTAIEYKYTRGSWDAVESWGSIVGFGNRQVLISYGPDGTQLVDNTATDWGNGADSTKAVQFWRDPFVTMYAPTGTDVNVNSPITVTWSMTMTADTDFEVMGSTGVVSGTFIHDVSAWTVTFTPDAPLAGGATYTVTTADQTSLALPGGESGVQQVTTVWSFTTAPYMVYLPAVMK